jgi:hypothetical protein
MQVPFLPQDVFLIIVGYHTRYMRVALPVLSFVDFSHLRYFGESAVLCSANKSLRALYYKSKSALFVDCMWKCILIVLITSDGVFFFKFDYQFRDQFFSYDWIGIRFVSQPHS